MDLTIKSKLSRDYYKYPLQYGEVPCYEDIYFLWVTSNLTYPEIAEYINCKPHRIRKAVKIHQMTKPKELKMQTVQRKTLEKYGVSHYSQLQEWKDRVKETCLEKYGVDSANKCQQVKDKIASTNLERYGVTVVSKNEKIKQKVKQTCRERYGTDYYISTDQFKQKSKETCLQKYGVDHVMKVDQVKEKLKQTNIDKYGVPYALMLDETIQKRKQTNLQKWGTTNISTAHIDPQILKILNDKHLLLDYINKFEVTDLKEIAKTMGISYDGIKKKLHELNIWEQVEHQVNHVETELQGLFPNFHKTRQILKPKEIDLYNDTYKLGIEYNGNYWHSELFKDIKYHQEKSLLAREKGIFLYHIYEHEWKDTRKKKIILSQLNNLIGNNTIKIGARKCIVKEIDNKICQQFLQENHLQGKDQSSVRLGLYFENNLVSVMTFCKPRFTNKYQWELSRFCNSLNTTICGGASKLFKYFIQHYNPKSIISYSNFSKTKGNIYPKLGFTYNDLSSPNYIWFTRQEVLSRYQCQKHKLKEYSAFGNTENEIMHNRGYLKLFDCGNFVWVWKA